MNAETGNSPITEESNARLLLTYFDIPKHFTHNRNEPTIFPITAFLVFINNSQEAFHKTIKDMIRFKGYYLRTDTLSEKSRIDNSITWTQVLEQQRNRIIFTSETVNNIITELTAPNFTIQERTRVENILNYTPINKRILKVNKGIILDLTNSNIIISSASNRRNFDFLYWDYNLIKLVPELEKLYPLNNSNEYKEQYRVPGTINEILELEIKKLLKKIDPAIELQEKVNKFYKDNIFLLKRNIEKYEKDIQQMRSNIDQCYITLQKTSFNLRQIQNTIDLDRTRPNKIVEQLKLFLTKNLIDDLELTCANSATTTNSVATINFTIPASPILYIDLDRLDRVLVSGKNFKHLEKIKSGEYAFFSDVVKVNFRINSNLDYSIRFENTSDATTHVKKACLGSYGNRLDEATKELEIAKIIFLIRQFVLSINIADVAGADSIETMRLINTKGEIVK